MPTTTRSLTIGSRTSNLAMWQTNHIIALLAQTWPDTECRVEPFVTKGDKTLDQPLPEIGGKGLFTLELEDALRNGRIDLAVHSLKDLPVENASGVTLGAIIGRADVRDVLVAANDKKLGSLPVGAIVGTSSLRRQAQLRQARPDLDIQSIRGNVETRIRKVMEGQYDATILAAAGITRLGLDDKVAQWLPLDVMLPAPGQGVLAVQCRADDVETLRMLSAIHQPEVATAVTAERSFLHHLGGGCATPVAAYAEWHGDKLHLTGLVAAVDGSKEIRVSGIGTGSWELGAEVAAIALGRGAQELLADG
ncbi:MAG: hydroxymethylbilane synthase [Anaerolineales bacterium]|nr:hydroxymethylbilane synthase [Anaerolineales bacterium]